MFETYTSSGKVFKKLALFLFAIVIVVVASMYFFLNNNSTKRSKAAIEQAVLLSLSPQTAEAKTDDLIVSTVKVGQMTRPVSAQGYEFYTDFDNTVFEVTDITYKLGTLSEDLGDSNSNLADVNQSGFIILQGEFNNSTAHVISEGEDIVQITYKVRSSTFGSSNIIYHGEIVELKTGGELSYINVPSKTLAVQNKALTGTPQVGNTTVKMAAKFQGIPSIPDRGPETKPMEVEVKISGEPFTQPLTRKVTFRSDSKGVWTGTMSFDLPDVSITGNVDNGPFSIYIKGPKHLKKRICVNVPTEVAAGSYSCAANGVDLNAGTVNSLDLTKITLMTGDLPVNNGTQNGFVDASDTSFIVLNYGKTTADVLSGGDLNLDGVVDTQDFSLIIASLKIKYDDPEE